MKYFKDKNVTLYLNNCLEELKNIPNNSIDSIVTDPPYGYSFMGKDWDKAIPSIDIWKECLRVLKSGAFAFIMSSPRQDCLSRMIINLQEAGFRVDFTSIYWSYACLSEDTLILTENGLKEINEISEKDIIYCFDIENEKLKKSNIKNIFKYDYNGNMYNLKNQNIDMLLTLNHKILHKNSKHSGNRRWDENWQYLEAKDLKLWDKLTIPISAKYDGNISLGEDFVKLLGWILIEGHYQKDCNAINIYQSDTNIQYVCEIRNLLNKLNIKYSEYKRNRIWKYKNKEKNYIEYQFYINDDVVNKIKKIIPNKLPTKELLDLIYEERLCLYETLIKGNGSFNKQKEHYQWTTDTFYQKNEKFMQWFEILLITLGFYGKRNKNKISISIKKQSTTQFQRINYKPKIVKYEGNIWCIETKYNNFVAYRNGRFFITGNSGFPKASNISKMIDKKLGYKRETIKEIKSGGYGYMMKTNEEQGFRPKNYYEETGNQIKNNEPISDQAKEFDGSYAGFQSKPAVEIIIVCMKPLSEKTFVEQALNNGHGITWLDDCRIPIKNIENEEGYRPNAMYHNHKAKGMNSIFNLGEVNRYYNLNGRFPANLLISNDILNDGNITKSGSGIKNSQKNPTCFNGFKDNYDGKINYNSDLGSFSRYFDLDFWFETKIKELPENIQKVFPFIIKVKASKSERNQGLDFEQYKIGGGISGTEDKSLKTGNGNERNNLNKNNHPCVKPVKLMSYLITLGSRKNDIILDPFMGSGSTGIAAKLLNRQFIGIEKEENYIKIAEQRIKSINTQEDLI